MGVRCFTSPILDHQNNVVASLGISNPIIRMTDEKMTDMANIGKYIAKTISLRCGHKT